MAGVQRTDGSVLPRRTAALAALSVTVAVTLSVYFACHHQANYQDDFRIYLAGARDLASGTLYSRQTHGEFFTYPPFAALVFLPLAMIPGTVAARVGWALVNDAALGALIACSIRAVRPDVPAGRRWLWAAGLAAPCFFLDPVVLTIRHGQINLLLAAMVVWDLTGPRRIGGLTVPGGLATGVAAAIKLTPLVFLPYLLLTGRPRDAWRCAGAFALCEAIGFAAAPAPSAAYWSRYLFSYPRAGGHLRLNGLLATANQDLMGSLARFAHAPVPPDVLWPAAGVIGAAGLALAVLAHSRRSAFFGVIVCATTGLIISPVTWTHHMVWVLPAIIWLAASPQRPRWGRPVAAATAILFWAAPVWWVPAGGFRPLHENIWQQIAGNSFFVWMILFLGAAAAAVLRHAPAAAAGQEPGPAAAGTLRQGQARSCR